MSKNRKNKAAQASNEAITSQKEMGSNVTPIRRTSNEAARTTSLPVHVEQIIRRRAYELFEQRGRADGHAQEDWLCAEAEVLGTVFRRARVG
jgi:hypothetical protein